MDSNDKSIVNITLDKGYKLVQQKNTDNTPRYNRIAITKGNNMEVMAVVPFYFMKELIKLYQEKEDAWKVKQQSKLDDKP